MSLLSLSRRILGREQAKEVKPDKAKKAAGKKKTKKEKATTASVAAGQMNLHFIITEKSMRVHDQNTLVVYVRPEATKEQIAAAVAEEYGVEPVQVRTMNVRPRTRRRGMTYGLTSARKKAYVQVKDISKLQEA